MNYKNEMAFVRWYELLDHGNLPLDKIDNAIECARLGWQQTCERHGILRLAAEHGLIPLGSVRKLVHIVRRDFAADNLNEAKFQEKNGNRYVEGTSVVLTLVLCKSVL